MDNFAIDEINITKHGKDNQVNFKIKNWLYQMSFYDGKIVFKTKEDLIQYTNTYKCKYLIFKQGYDFVVTTLCGEILFKKKCIYLELLNKDIFKFQTAKGWGLLDKYGDIIVEPKYQEFLSVNNEHNIIAKQDEKYGIINDKEVVVIPFIYDEIINSYPFLKVKQNGKYGIMDKTGQAILPIKYSEIETYHDSFFKVEELGKKYIIDDKENIILDGEYTDIIYLDWQRHYSVGDYFVQNNERKWGLIKESGDIVFDYKYTSINSINMLNTKDLKIAYIVQNKNGLYGLIDENEKIILPFEYDDIAKYHMLNNTIIVSKNSKYGVIDLNGNTKIDFKYKTLVDNNTYGDMFWAEDFNNNWELINENGNTISIDLDKIPEVKPFKKKAINKNVKVENFRESDFIFEDKFGVYTWGNKNFRVLKKDNYNYIINSSAKILFKTKYNIYEECDNFIIFETNDKKFVADYNGNILIKPIYQDIEYLYTDDYFAIQENNKWGIIKANAGIIIKPKYDKISYDCRNKKYFTAELNDKIGLIDEFDNAIIPFVFDGNSNHFWFFDKDSKIITQKNEKSGIINFNGKTIIPFEYDNIGINEDSKNYIVAEINECDGIIDWNNNVILPFEYATLYPLSDKTLIGNIEYMESGSYLLNYKGDKIYNKNFDCIYRLKNEDIQADYFIASLKHECGFGLVDEFGNQIIDFKYNDFDWHFSKEKNKFYFTVENDFGNYGIIDIDDNTIIPFEYEEIRYIHNTEIIAMKDNKYGVIDIDNNILIDFKFEDIHSFINNYAPAKLNNAIGLINKNGESIKFDLSKVKELKI